jgi:outer membrane protein OmpA-like peptidoglycan-associated protein
MELNRLKQICLIILFLTFFSYSANAQSAESLVSPFTGSELLGTYEAKLAPLTLLVEPLDVKNNPSTLEVEGSLQSNIYERPANVAPYEIYKSYQKVLQDADFDILLACQDGKCSSKKTVKSIYGHPRKEIENRKYTPQMKTSTQSWLVGWANHYISAKKKTADKTYYVMVIVSDQRDLYSIDVLEVEEMEEGNVELNPKLLKDKIASEGKVVLDGIFFETGKDILMETSKPSLNTISKFLKENTNLSFYVVGHTDDTGNLEANISLSKKRAEAVVAALVDLGINNSQITGHGVGPFAPAANNYSDSGKAKNRRVELVARLK